MDTQIPSKTSRSVPSVPGIIPKIKWKVHRFFNKTHLKAKKTGSSKLCSKLESSSEEIKADVRKHDLYVNIPL